MSEKEFTPTPSELPSQRRPLLRLLLKLGLMNTALHEKYRAESDLFPIADLATRGCFDETWAIEQIARELRIQIFYPNPTLEAEAFRLLEHPSLNAFSLQQWHSARALPLKITEDELLVAVADPLDGEFQKHAEFLLGLRVRSMIGSERQICELLRAKSEGRSVLNFEELFTTSAPLEIRHSGVTPTSKLEQNVPRKEDVSEPTVVKLVNRILAAAVNLRASDIHISPQQDRLHVRIRVDGIMRDLVTPPIALADSVTARMKILCGMDITERRQPQDARLRLNTDAGARDLRISSLPTAFGEDIVIRILATNMESLSLDGLSMPNWLQTRLREKLHGTSKVHLVTGPTGSGKTTTLYAALLAVRNGTNHIMTIEDPIEYRLEAISQVQVNSKIGLTFASALRSILRQDPDIILVGEIRDAETAEIAMQAAQTGHLVLSTLHTNSAPAAITRLRDMGLPSFVIAESIGSISAQRLVRKLCPSCACGDGGDLRAKSFGIENPQKGVGCDECSHTGFIGRLPVYSFFEITPQISDLIRKEASEEELQEAARQQGFLSLEDSGLELVRAGLTTLAEVERIIGPIRATQPHTPHTPKSSPGIEKRKLLLVDDDDDIRETFQMVFEAQMFDVAQARNGMDALNQIYMSPPDVIVLDYMMPKVNGLEVVEKLRADPRTRKIPVLMLTACSRDEIEADLIKRGADDFVSKTARTEVITARINRLLNRE